MKYDGDLRSGNSSDACDLEAGGRVSTDTLLRLVAMQVVESREDPRLQPKGSLQIVGTGIEAISQLSLGTISAIRSAEIVFYHIFNPVILRCVTELNRNALDLFRFYGEGKLRQITYIQMSEVMLDAVRAGQRVVGVFSGHPGIFVMASRRAVAIALREGYEAHLSPAISSVDCLIADLRIDPGVHGLQIIKAGSLLRGRVMPSTSSHLALLQVGSVGDSTYSFGGFKNSKQRQLFEMLLGLYGADHDAVYYEAPTVPGDSAKIDVGRLSTYFQSTDVKKLGFGIIYLPPRGQTYEAARSWGISQKSDIERKAIYELTHERLDWRSPRRVSSSDEVAAILADLGVGSLSASKVKIFHKQNFERNSVGRVVRVPSEGKTSEAGRKREVKNENEWKNHGYFYHQAGLFAPSEARSIIDLSALQKSMESELKTHSGVILRSSALFWIAKDASTEWIFHRVGGLVRSWNEAFNFDLDCDGPSKAQLTCYRAAQEYGWHMDIGSGPASKRKISVVVGLNDGSEYDGGGTEIFYGDVGNPCFRLGVGDVLLFPSYVMHRACPVASGERWTLVFWYSGSRPFR